MINIIKVFCWKEIVVNADFGFVWKICNSDKNVIKTVIKL